MTDVFSKSQRSQIMSRVKSTGNKATESVFANALRKYGLNGWRRKQKVFGHPDFVFWKQRVAIFVDGCFWHCCPEHGSLPADNAAFWQAKLARNRARDAIVNSTLTQRGWCVVRIWQHALSPTHIDDTMKWTRVVLEKPIRGVAE